MSLIYRFSVFFSDFFKIKSRKTSDFSEETDLKNSKMRLFMISKRGRKIEELEELLLLAS